MITQKFELNGTPQLINLTKSAILFNKSKIGIRGGRAIALAVTNGEIPNEEIYLTLFSDEDKFYEYVDGEVLYAWGLNNELATLIIG